MNSSKKQANQLPNGWTWVSIGETGKYINGFAFKPSHREATGLPIVRIQNLTDKTKPLNTTTLDISQEYKINSGDMLVSWSATLDVFIWNRGPALVNQHIFKVTPDERIISKELLFHWLRRAIQELQDSEHLHGSTMLHINRGPFLAHRVPMPPLPEQTRIVEKLEELLSQLDAGASELKAAQQKLERYRQSLLKAAVEGRLTAEWREKNRPTESGEQLLNRILRERRQRWESQQLAKFEAQGKKPPKDWQKKYPEPVKPDTSDLPELPEGWVWASVEQLGVVASGSTPKNVENHVFANGSIPWFKVGDMNTDGNEINLNASRSNITKEYAQKNGMKIIPKGSIVFPKRGGAIATNKKRVLSKPSCIDLNMMAITFYQDIASWSKLWFDTIDLRKLSDGSNVPQINNPDILPLPIPLPPILEQQEALNQSLNTVTETSSLKDFLLKLSARISSQRQNILRAAFAGELVPQDPNDEPASDLLARIQAERAAQAPRKGGKAKQQAGGTEAQPRKPRARKPKEDT